MTKVDYTQHARFKFEVLKRHGLEVTQDQVEHTVLNPETITHRQAV
jgi:hypothetical protein